MDDTTNHDAVTESRDDRLIVRRTFDAPRERVWRTFTDPDELEQWFVPEGMTAEVRVNEREPGGEMSVIWTNNDQRIVNEGYYIEVVEYERLVSGEETEAGELRLTYEFREVDGGTAVVITQEFPGPVPDGAAEGWTGMLDQLAEVLADGSTMDAPSNDARTVTVSRFLEAPPERVYDAFLDPAELAAWYPPTGYTGEVHHLEPEGGGTYRMTFYGDTEERADFEQTFGGTYRELSRGERIVYTDEFESDDPEMAGEMTVTVTFEAVDGGTEITVRQENIPEAIPPADANAGWNDSLESLADLVTAGSVLDATDTSLTIRRTFDAPREAVWAAWTDPDEMKRWYGANLMDVEIHALEAEPGGSFSITMRDDDDSYDVDGEFLEVVEPERLVHTWYVGRVTVDLESVEGATELVFTHEKLPDRETTDLHAEGWLAAVESLATTLASDEGHER
ncbi:SRPBCC domain-containing protein [Natrarchaeobius sp. A-rgal3]|uniref:SRPBCC domain-containing protein n=1 Tax=Natrarchaeobius versutus TaxID=1679078 RepID=UPI0035105E24